MTPLEQIKKLTKDWNPEGGSPTGVLLLPSKRGTGSTQVARRIWKLLHDQEQPKSVASDRHRIYGMAGLLPPNPYEPGEDPDRDLAILTRLRKAPLRAPHHTCSPLGMSGSCGGVWAHPGEVHLAHGGVLLLDEAEEFRRELLDEVAVAWTDGKLGLHGAQGKLRLPCSFFLVCVVHDVDRWEKLTRVGGGFIHRLNKLQPILLDSASAEEIIAAVEV